MGAALKPTQGIGRWGLWSSRNGNEGREMNCKSCNTRLPKAGEPCPHCGHVERVSQFIDQMPMDNAEPSVAPIDEGLGEAMEPREVELPLEAAVCEEFTLEAVTEAEMDVDVAVEPNLSGAEEPSAIEADDVAFAAATEELADSPAVNVGASDTSSVAAATDTPTPVRPPPPPPPFSARFSNPISDPIAHHQPQEQRDGSRDFGGSDGPRAVGSSGRGSARVARTRPVLVLRRRGH